jgi:hypothetical protein
MDLQVFMLKPKITQKEKKNLFFVSGEGFALVKSLWELNLEMEIWNHVKEGMMNEQIICCKLPNPINEVFNLECSGSNGCRFGFFLEG